MFRLINSYSSRVSLGYNFTKSLPLIRLFFFIPCTFKRRSHIVSGHGKGFYLFSIVVKNQNGTTSSSQPLSWKHGFYNWVHYTLSKLLSTYRYLKYASSL